MGVVRCCYCNGSGMEEKSGLGCFGMLYVLLNVVLYVLLCMDGLGGMEWVLVGC